MSNANVVVVGSSNMDIFCYTDHLPAPGETLIGDSYSMSLGGKGANQAVAARLLGAEVTLVGRVGDDLFGQRMLDNFSSHGMAHDHIQVDREAGSGVAVILVDKQAENSLVVVPGANMRIAPADVEAAAGVLRGADVLMMQMEIPLDAIQRAVDIAREGDTLSVLNPAPARPLPDTILERVHVLTPNQSEAKMLTGIPTHTLEGAEAAGRALLDKGVRTVIITLSARGALIVRPGETTHVEGVSVDAVDTTGAGDAFCAGLAVALAEGKTLEQATRLANLAGALSATKPGAMPSLPNREEVEAFAQALESQTY
jgi:ribokinase